MKEIDFLLTPMQVRLLDANRCESELGVKCPDVDKPPLFDETGVPINP
jgi:hypothetical protein